MTEKEWLKSSDPEKMLLGIRDFVSERKMRLFAITCCRRIWDRITDPRCRAAVEFAERFVEVGVARRRGRPAVVQAAQHACREADHTAYYSRHPPTAPRLIPGNALHAALASIDGSAWFAAHLASGFAANVIGLEWICDNNGDTIDCRNAAQRAERQLQAPILRDIFGNPFRPLPVLSITILAWHGGTVQNLAQAMYDENTFDQMPILADALEDAGCADHVLLTHLRGAGPHVRGCWAIDLLLGKN